MLLLSFGSFQRRPGCSRLLLAAPACSWRLPGCSLATLGRSRILPGCCPAGSGPLLGVPACFPAAPGCSQWLAWLFPAATWALPRASCCSCSLGTTLGDPGCSRRLPWLLPSTTWAPPGCSWLLLAAPRCPQLPLPSWRRLRQLWHRARSEMPRRDSGGPSGEV